MSEDDIDLDRVLIDPEYRRKVIEFLNATAQVERERSSARPPAADPRMTAFPRT